jgi:cytochrome c oxidase subunit 2
MQMILLHKGGKKMGVQQTVLILFLISALLGCGRGGQQEKEEGLKLLQVNGCVGCHSLDGSKKIGPTLKGVYGSEVTVITNGTKRTITADRDYLRRSILDPRADVVEGFQPVMPTNFGTQIREKNLDIILDYLESLGKK